MIPAMNEVLETFARERCSAILRTDVATAVQPAMEAAIDGGFRIVEFTLNTPGALDAIRAFARRDDAVVGAGTVLSRPDAEAAVAAGARFLVSPVVDPELVQFCTDRELLCIPGTYTPTEMLLAHRCGAQIVKLFPGPSNGPEFVRACLGPLPFLRIFPTSGVDRDNAAAFLAAGAFGVGFVGSLFRRDDLAAHQFDRVRDRARRLVEVVRAARAASGARA
jgi:Entner-Doudoroff aldolase